MAGCIGGRTRDSRTILGAGRGAWGPVGWATYLCDPGMVIATPHLPFAGPQHLVYRWPMGAGLLHEGMPSCGCPRPQSHPGETDGPSLILGPKDWAVRWAGTGDPNLLGLSHTLWPSTCPPPGNGHTHCPDVHTDAGKGDYSAHRRGAVCE